MRNVLIVGLSALGEGLVRALGGKVRIFAVDRLPERVDSQASVGRAEVACFDATDPMALADFVGEHRIDVAVVAVGGDFLSAEQVAEALRDLRGSDGKRRIGRVIVTANRPYRARILKELGYDVVRPMIDAAESLAELVASDGMAAFTRLGRLAGETSATYGVAELPVTGAPLVVDVFEAKNPGCRVIAVRRADGRLLVPPPLQAGEGTHLIVAGPVPHPDRGQPAKSRGRSGGAAGTGAR